VRRSALWIGLALVAVLVVSWFDSKSHYRTAAVDISPLRMRVGMAASNGILFFKYGEIRFGPSGWEPVAQAELDALFFGFGVFLDRDCGEVAVPHWALVLALCLCSTWIGRAGHRRHPPQGLCPGCGYDLRATPGRCPECGLKRPPA
jgi:hypothetical protein